MQRYSSSNCEINYHIIWCPKYRKKILVKDVKKYLETQLHTICNSKNWNIIEMEIMPDHIHIFISTPPYDSPTNIVKVLKGVSARNLYKEFGYLKDGFRKGHIWSPSYYVGTAGKISSETIKRYIQEQSKGGVNSSTV